ncbi:MAG: SRPBCC domain-containing protein [Bacteroidia bacterium]|nr:SRPBCC domain-containing protein [Bacteroidia bacterium]
MDHIVRKSIDIKAEPGKVWEALTNPELTRKYFFNAEVYSGWKVGSPIVFKGRMFLIKKFEMNGEIKAIERNKFLKYTLKNSSDKGKTFSTVTDSLVYKDGVTTFSVSDDVGEGEGAEKRYKRSEKGWSKILERLKEIVESQEK